MAVLCGCSGQQQVSLQDYSRTAIVSADGRTLIVGPYGLQCGGTVTAVARETASRVALFLQYVPGGHACRPGEGSMPMVAAQSIRLHAPLGHRELVDGETGAATPWLSARFILRPRQIPAGYRSTGLQPWMSLSLYPDGVPSSAACEQVYQEQNRTKQLDIIQGADGVQLQGGGDLKPIRVRGLPGQAAAGMITWREHGLTDVIWTNGELTTAQLIAIADSAPA